MQTIPCTHHTIAHRIQYAKLVLPSSKYQFTHLLNRTTISEKRQANISTHVQVPAEAPDLHGAKARHAGRQGVVVDHFDHGARHGRGVARYGVQERWKPACTGHGGKEFQTQDPAHLAWRKGISDTTSCPSCDQPQQHTEHIFSCPIHPTTLSVWDLWRNPVGVAELLATIPCFGLGTPRLPPEPAAQ